MGRNTLPVLDPDIGKGEHLVFYSNDDDGYVQALEGISRKTLVYGDHTLLTQFRMDRGSALPLHAHPYEQTGYLVSGHMRLTIGSETFDTQPGDSWCICSGVEHGAEILADTVAIEVFSPAREDYLPCGRV